MTRIAIPKWANKFTVKVEDEFGQEEYRCLSTHRVQILEAVQKAVEEYVNDDDYVADGLFPQRERMTGEYYIACESYSSRHKELRPYGDERRWGERQWRFSLSAHCLEKRWLDNQSDFNYLGLEVHFLWEPAEQQITFGGIDSSSI